MSFCGRCGSPVSSAYCTHCGVKSEGGSPPPTGYNRSPLQVLLLHYATFGIYGIFWFIRATWLCERRLSVSERTNFWALLVPFFNLVVYYYGIGRIEDRIEGSGVKPPIPLWVQALTSAIVSMLWRLPEPYFLLCLLSAPFIATMHVSLCNAERNDGFVRTNKLTGWEIAILVVGFATLGLTFLGATVDVKPAVIAFVWCVIGCIAITMLIFLQIGARQSRVAGAGVARAR